MRKVFLAIVLSPFLLVGLIYAYVYAHTFSNDRVGVSTTFAESTLLAEPPPPLADPVTLRLVTFNIQDLHVVARDHEDRMRAIAKKLGTLDPDIVGFQEAFIADHRALLTEALTRETRLAHFQYFDSAYMGSGLLIASAFPIEETWFLRYSASNPWWKLWEGDYWAGKGAGLARVRLPSGGLVDFFTTHAQAGYGNPRYNIVRKDQMAELGAFIRDARLGTVPAFLTGDMNCRPGAEDYETVVTTANLVRVMNERTAIDHIFAVDDPAYSLEVLETVRIEETVTSGDKTFDLSDHPGYLSTVRVSPQAANP
jgi:sphingomyelin phosphodiesterase 2